MVTIKGNTYTINTAAIGDFKMLIKNGKPVLLIPEELEEDFIQLLVYAGAADKFLYPETDLITNKTNENENKI